MRELAAALRNQPPMWLSTASVKIRSRPMRACSTCGGTLPLRKPGIFTASARSCVACSTACFRSACGTSTVSLTRLSGSSSTWVAMTRPIQAERPGVTVSARDRRNVAQPSFRRALQLVVGLAGAVLARLEPGQQPDAAEGDRVRARVVADVVRLLRSVGEIRDAAVARDDRVGGARPRRAGDDMARAELVILADRTECRRGGSWPKLERPCSFEHDERLGLEGVDVRNGAALARRPANPVQPRALGSRGGREQLVTVLVEGEIVEADHVRGPLPRLGELELADLGLDLPGVVHASFRPGIAEPQGLRAREPAVLDRVPRPEDEVVETLGAAFERVLETVGHLDDRVAGPHLADGFVLPEQARAGEHVIDLLREPV